MYPDGWSCNRRRAWISDTDHRGHTDRLAYTYPASLGQVHELLLLLLLLVMGP